MNLTGSKTTRIGVPMLVMAVIGSIMVRCSSDSDASAPFGPPEGTLSAADARAALGRVPTLGAVAAPKYGRDEFGKPWTDVDRNSCDTRSDILARDAVRSGGTVERYQGCKVVAIRMVEPYAGKSVTATSEVDIDHVVPLSVAWRSGAHAWKPDARLALANDPRNLLVADDDTNQHDKGDKTPDRWLPVVESRCTYAQMYVTVLDVYRLPASVATRSALAKVLVGC